jgi:hypothetical protein
LSHLFAETSASLYHLDASLFTRLILDIHLLTLPLLLQLKDKPVLSATGPVFLDSLMREATEEYTLLPCENFQRLPLHLSSEEEVSPFMSQLHREVAGRLAPMKWCGDYHNNECQYGKHHNTASYLPETGIIKLMFWR